MAGEWTSLWGDLASTGGMLGGIGIGKMFGMDGGSQASSMNNAGLDLQQKALENDIRLQQSRNLASLTNQAGLTGNAAALDAQRALDEKNGPSADAIFNSNNIVNNAQSGLGAAFNQGNLARIGAAQQSGNMIDAIRNGNAGGSVASLGIINNASKQMAQNVIGATSAANDAISRANTNLSNAYGQSQGMLDASRNTQFNTQVAPHLTSVNATNNSANSTISAVGGGSTATAGGTGMFGNVLAGLSTNLADQAGQANALEGAAKGGALGAKQGDLESYFGSLTQAQKQAILDKLMNPNG